MMQPLLGMLEQATRILATTRNSNPDVAAYAGATAAAFAALHEAARRIASGSSCEPAAELAAIEAAVVQILAAKCLPEVERVERLAPLRAHAFGVVMALHGPAAAGHGEARAAEAGVARHARVEEAA